MDYLTLMPLQEQLTEALMYGSCIIYNLTFVFNLATTFQIYWINHLIILDQSFDYSGSII